jgi:predicted RNA-binding Zn-ribbon protein involved in translation (DUF1610 family)
VTDKYGHCPQCGADWDEGPIPEAIREHYSPPYRWSRCIAIVDRDLDRQVAWKCPDCGVEQPLNIFPALKGGVSRGGR